MSIFSQPDRVTPQTTLETGVSTGIPQGGRLEKHPKATEAAAEGSGTTDKTDAAKKLAAKKLKAIQKLAELSLSVDEPGTKKARKAIRKYLGDALDVFEVLGPEFESVIALKIIKGIESKSLKETVATLMWDKEWKLIDLNKILMASVE